MHQGKKLRIIWICAILAVLGGAALFLVPRLQKRPQGAAAAERPGGAQAEAETARQDGETFKIITAEEAKGMMDAGGVTIVDVRRQNEYDAGHVKDAILVPNETIGDIAPEELPDKDAILLVYCRTGVRAAEAAGKLAELGYTQVYDFGGIVDWPYETQQ